MATVLNLVLFGGVLVLHTLVAAVSTRFFRIRMGTQWGSVLYALLVTPLLLLVSTLLFTGVLGIGVNLGNSATAVGVMIGLPLALGFTIDVLYMPTPDEYDVPDTTN
ncbi:hypothetical protein ACFO0N_06505 [Halobium salinum]|uniref:DUF7991 domain-containing protein n=1 Tax=Halobium salinum TaxID=1364940 RepID=A0ABD5P9Q5_9EURY|nr:hypothetical protein [Halobium salinum]